MKTAVPAGYQLTDVGVIPLDWECGELGDYLASRPNYGINAAAVPYSDRLPVYVRITDINSDGRFCPKDAVSVDSALSMNYYLNDGDIVLARTGASVGKSYKYDLHDGPLVFAGFLIKIEPNIEKVVPNFIAAYLTTGSYWGWVRLMSMRSGQPGINGKEYAQLPIPVPPLAEQRAIATALSDMDALLAAQDALIVKKQDIKQATMQQLLTGKTRLPGFSGAWAVRRIDELAVLYQPITIAANGFTEFGFPVYGANGIVGFYHSANHETWQVTVTCRGSTCGTINRTDAKSWITGNAMVLNCDQNKVLNKEFFYHLMDSQDLTSCITGSGLPQIVRSPLGAFKVHLPVEIAEQTAIATVLSDLDAEITALQTRRHKTRNLKQAMMQALLTGRVRLANI